MKTNHQIILIFLIAIFSGCARESSFEDPIVAKVGDKVITASEFKKNYEFGLSHLKTGKNPKRTYLDYMIKEQILAQQGYRFGLDQAAGVQKAIQRLEDELLIEELFLHEVHQKITVTEAEINEALNKSKISWKFRFWIEPTYAGAKIVADAMREHGYAGVVESFLNNSPESPLSPRDFESGYVTWLEVPDELLKAIQNLPRGDISDPIALNGVYYIIQITDIRREGILENEYHDKASSIKKILYNRKVMEAAFKYVSDFLTPKQIVTKGESFRLLANALAAWKKSQTKLSFSGAIKSASLDDEALFALKTRLSETLVTYKNGDWTIREFITEKLDLEQLTADPAEANEFNQQLNNAIALGVRNHFLIKEARSQKLDQAENVHRQLRNWQDKWVYQETRHYYTQHLNITPELLKVYFENHKQNYKIRRDKEPTFEEFKAKIKQDAYLAEAKKILEEKTDSLLTDIPVTINDSVLDTIQVINSRKSKWMSVQLFKKSNNKLAFPIVDPAWGL